MLKIAEKYANKVIRLMKPYLKYLENPFVMGSVILFLVLYGALAKPELPDFMKNLMKNDIFRVFYIFLIAYTGDKNLMVSIIVAFVFMVLFGLLSEIEVQETFENTDLAENLQTELDKLLDELDTVTKGSEEIVEKEQPESEGE
jgi:hypothetical protein